MGQIRASAPDPSFALTHPLTRFLPTELRATAQALLVPAAPIDPPPPSFSPPPLPQDRQSPPPTVPITPTCDPPVLTEPSRRVAEVSLPPLSSNPSRPCPRPRLPSEEPLDIDNLVRRPPLSSAQRSRGRIVEVLAKVCDIYTSITDFS